MAQMFRVWEGFGEFMVGGVRVEGSGAYHLGLKGFWA